MPSYLEYIEGEAKRIKVFLQTVKTQVWHGKVENSNKKFRWLDINFLFYGSVPSFQNTFGLGVSPKIQRKYCKHAVSDQENKSG